MSEETKKERAWHYKISRWVEYPPVSVVPPTAEGYIFARAFTTDGFMCPVTIRLFLVKELKTQKAVFPEGLARSAKTPDAVMDMYYKELYKGILKR